MKKFLIGCLILITACQGIDSAPMPESTSTPTAPPTLEPVTPTPTLPPAPTDTPPPTLVPYYFTDDFSIPSTQWEFFQTGGVTKPSFSYENNILRIDIASPDTWSIGIHNAHSYPNIFIRAKVSASPSGSAGLVCRYDEKAGWFEFNAASDGTYNALYGQWLAPGIAKYIPIIADRSVHLGSGALNYELGLSCQDNFIYLYVNDVIIRRLDVTNFGLTEGKVGITASSLTEAPITARFEWVRVGME